MKKKTAKVKVEKDKSLFNLIESFFELRSKWFLIGSLVLSFAISMFLFNREVSIGGDDSGYIKFAFDFSKGLSYPAWHSPFYSMVLSFFILIFGVNVFFLKLTSILFNLTAIYFLYRFFKKYANYTVAVFVTLITSINYLFCYYSSTTYSESFFFLFQIIFFYYFIEIVSKTNNSKDDFKKNLKHFMILGLLSYLLFLTKTVAVAVIFASIVYLLINKHFLNSLLFSGSVILSHLILTISKKLIWNSQKVGFEDQLDALLLKDPYKPQLGNEDISGFIQRLWDNSELYLSKHIMKMLGVFPADYTKTSMVITIILYVLLFGSAVYLIIKNKKYVHLILSVAGMIATTFIILQKIWDQDRLIMIFFPFIIVIIVYAFYLIFQIQFLKKFQFIVILLMGMILVLNGVQSMSQIQKKEREKRFQKGEFGSYTPDWQNYMQASKWAGDNLPNTSVVVCRKPEMSWIASSGKDIFSGVFRLEYQNIDSVYNMIVGKKATHVILENFRMNPKKKTDKTITTIRNVLLFLTYKNPGCLKFVKEFGEDEKAYVFEINLDEQKGSEQYFKNLETALIAAPKNANLYIEKAKNLKVKNGISEAMKVYDEALVFLPEEPYIYFNRGLLFFELGNYKDALNDFKKATDFNDKMNQSWYNQAICHFYLGDFKSARTTLEKAKSTGMKNYQQFEQMLSGYN